MPGPLTTSPSAPRLLLVENDDPAIQLPGLLSRHIPELLIDSCPTVQSAIDQVRETSYHAIICSPSSVISNGTSFLTHSRRLQPAAPFLMTLLEDERDSMRIWLEYGVHDFIFKPIIESEALESVHEALVIYKVRQAVIHRQEAVIKARTRRDRFQGRDLDDSIKQEVLGLLDQSIRRMEDSAESLSASLHAIQKTVEALRKSP
jgi:response regulator RpfG family c-di-GMP phosphodiesterase